MAQGLLIEVDGFYLRVERKTVFGYYMSLLRSPILPPIWQIVLLLLAVITFYGVAHPAELNLTWQDNSTNEERFKIERRQVFANIHLR